MPDYDLYNEWINSQLDIINEKTGKPKFKKNEFKEYLDYSHGFLTRGCFRKCGFCVNQKYDCVVKHSPLEEFYDPSRKKICLNDDNFLGYTGWKPLLQQLIDTGKPFKFKQGLDERILTDEKCEMLFNCKYDGDVTFAFDKIEDYEIIRNKLEMIRKYTSKQCVFYVLCGFDPTGRYNEEFWLKDIIDTFERIKLLGSYGMLPYLMRYNKYNESPYRGIYITIARWCNQFSYFKKETIEEYSYITDYNSGGRSSQRYLGNFEKQHKELYYKYFKTKYYYKP